MEPSKRIAKSNSINLLESGINTWHHVAPFGTTLSDVLRPEYWINKPYGMKENDEIRILTEDKSFYAHLLVESVTNTSVYVIKLFSTFLNVKAEPLDKTGYRIDFGGPQKYRIVRNLDGVVIDKGFPNKPAAQEAIDKLLGVVAEAA